MASNELKHKYIFSDDYVKKMLAKFPFSDEEKKVLSKLPTTVIGFHISPYDDENDDFVCIELSNEKGEKIGISRCFVNEMPNY